MAGEKVTLNRNELKFFLEEPENEIPEALTSQLSEKDIKELDRHRLLDQNLKKLFAEIHEVTDSPFSVSEQSSEKTANWRDKLLAEIKQDSTDTAKEITGQAVEPGRKKFGFFWPDFSLFRLKWDLILPIPTERFAAVAGVFVIAAIGLGIAFSGVFSVPGSEQQMELAMKKGPAAETSFTRKKEDAAASGSVIGAEENRSYFRHRSLTIERTDEGAEKIWLPPESVQQWKALEEIVNEAENDEQKRQALQNLYNFMVEHKIPNASEVLKELESFQQQ